jgi:L-histidine N-alpha-methyltransferase
MAEEVRAGLTAEPLKSLPSKYFYDDRGCALYERIVALPEYYPSRTEETILERVADEVVARAGPRELVELGAGAGKKTRLLLDAMRRAGRLERCVLLDLSTPYLGDAVARLAAAYPGVAVRGVVADFTKDLSALGRGGGRLVLFLAGTVGNLPPEEVPALLSSVASVLAPGDRFLLGVDLVKDPKRLHDAYNDAAGVTAEFNRNILRVVNERLGADFDVSAFAHVAFYDRERSWIEMRLRALRPTRVRIPAAGLDVEFAPGEEIRTELSCKYTRASLEARLAGTPLRLERWYTDPESLFALALLERA